MHPLNQTISLFIVATVGLFFASCYSKGTWSDSANLLSSTEEQKINILSTSLGQRTFDTQPENLIKAFTTAFSNKNLTVLTLEQGAGFIMAEGPQFLKTNVLLKIYGERNNNTNSQMGNSLGYIFPIPIDTLRVTVNFYKKEKGLTIVKMKINTVLKNCITFDGGNPVIMESSNLNPSRCPQSSTMVSMWYQQLWDEIEKSIFMQRETILE